MLSKRHTGNRLSQHQGVRTGLSVPTSAGERACSKSGLRHFPVCHRLHLEQLFSAILANMFVFFFCPL